MTTRMNDAALLLGRLAIAALFLPAGVGKLFNLDGFAASLAGKGLPNPDLLALLGAGAEVIGPIALILGVAPRLTAVLLVGFTVVATLISHTFWTYPEAQQSAQQTQFFKNAAIAGGLLFYFVSGAGAFSLPGLLRARVDSSETARGAPTQA
jgi:putative oxidoreductase